MRGKILLLIICIIELYKQILIFVPIDASSSNTSEKYILMINLSISDVLLARVNISTEYEAKQVISTKKQSRRQFEKCMCKSHFRKPKTHPSPTNYA